MVEGEAVGFSWISLIKLEARVNEGLAASAAAEVGVGVGVGVEGGWSTHTFATWSSVNV